MKYTSDERIDTYNDWQAAQKFLMGSVVPWCTQQVRSS